jgi:hypothetical protein
MAPQLISFNVFGQNLIDVDCNQKIRKNLEDFAFSNEVPVHVQLSTPNFLGFHARAWPG